MSLITWNNTFDVKIKEFDDQHKVLVGYINELYDAMIGGKGKEVIGSILNNLIYYTESHFKTEEKFFEKYSYPERSVHIMEHRDFTAKVTEFKAGYENGKLSISVEVLNFLKSWLQNHIKVTDQKYTDFFNSKGLK